MILRWRETMTGFLPLAVASTLVCCAIPITLVALGAGSVVASLVSAAPWLVAMTHYKGWLFLGVGALLGLNYWALFRSSAACEPGASCHYSQPLGRWLRRVYWGSVAAYTIGVGAAYLSLPIANLFG